MTPHPTEAELNDFAGRELPPARAAAVERHLEACDECRAKAERLQSLLLALSAAPREAEPRRDLWPLLAARMEAADDEAADLAGFESFEAFERFEAMDDFDADDGSDARVIPLRRRAAAPQSAWLQRAAAAAILFVGGVGLGRFTAPAAEVQPPAIVYQPEVRPAATTAREAAARVQQEGSEYVQAVARLTSLTQGAEDDSAAAQGREATLAAMYSAAKELASASSADTTAVQLFQSVANVLVAEGSLPPQPPREDGDVPGTFF